MVSHGGRGCLHCRNAFWVMNRITMSVTHMNAGFDDEETCHGIFKTVSYTFYVVFTWIVGRPVDE